MKKKMIIVTVLLALMVSSPLMAQEKPAIARDKITTNQMMQNIDSSMMKMKDMRQKIETTSNKKSQMKMMNNHMQMMQKMMAKMNMMGNQGGMNKQGTGQQGSMGQGMMNGNMQNMKGKQGAMNQQGATGQQGSISQGKMNGNMQNMKGQGGGMHGKMMKNCMMGNNMQMKGSLQTLEKKMEIMQEIMSGLMTQQKMMMKNIK